MQELLERERRNFSCMSTMILVERYYLKLNWKRYAS